MPRQQVVGLRCWTIPVNVAQSSRWKCAKFTVVVLCWGTGIIFPRTELQAVCRIFRILSVKKDAKSSHDLVDNSSGGTDIGLYFKLSTQKIRCMYCCYFHLSSLRERIVLLFSVSGYSCRVSFCKCYNEFELNWICFLPPAFYLLALSFLDLYFFCISPRCLLLTRQLWSLWGQWYQ